jgi:hypothetical protein
MPNHSRQNGEVCAGDESAKSLKVPFGRSVSNGRIYAALDVLSGKECDCVCPSCGTALIAKHAPNGGTTPHFAHATAVDCAGGYESAIHLAAKQIILEERRLFFPSLVAEVNEVDARGHCHVRSRVLATADTQNLSDVRLEVWQPGFRPDLVVWAGDHTDRVFIEIAVTHFVDDVKLTQVRAANAPLLEFDLSGIPDASWNSLRDALTTQKGLAVWLFHPWLSASLAELRESLQPILDQAKQYAWAAAEEERAWRLAADERERLEEDEAAALAAQQQKEKRSRQIAERAREQQLRQRIQRFRLASDAERARLVAHAFDRERVPSAVSTKVSGGRSFGVSNQGIWQSVVFRRFIHMAVRERRTLLEKEEIVKVLREYFEAKPEFPEAEQVAVWKYLWYLRDRGALRHAWSGVFHIMVTGLEAFETLGAFHSGTVTIESGLFWRNLDEWPDERVNELLAEAHSSAGIRNLPGRDPILLPVVIDRPIASVLEKYAKGISATAVLEYWISAGFLTSARTT